MDAVEADGSSRDADVAAAVDDEEPLSADHRTFAEILGYRQALGYVLTMAAIEHFVLAAATIRSMHFVLPGHDPSNSPGRNCTGPSFVQDDATDAQVKEGPDAHLVAGLVDELVESLTSSHTDALVQAAMAHLTLVTIPPFRDGDGRLPRALQTLVLARRGLADPAFSSIVEWLGANMADYHRGLAQPGHPDRDTGLWVSFNLGPPHAGADPPTTHRPGRGQVDGNELSSGQGLPYRAGLSPSEAALGHRIRRHLPQVRRSRGANRDARPSAACRPRPPAHGRRTSCARSTNLQRPVGEPPAHGRRTSCARSTRRRDCPTSPAPTWRRSPTCAWHRAGGRRAGWASGGVARGWRVTSAPRAPRVTEL